MALLINPSSPQPADAPSDLIRDGNTNTFAADVLDASLKVPVIVDFWAPWCGPCKQLTPILEKLVRAASGAVRLVKINVDENQELAAQLRIQSIPAVYAFHGGRAVDGFVGAQTESQVRAFVDRLTAASGSPVEDALAQAREALESGDARTAVTIFGEVLREDPSNPKAVAGLIRARVAIGDLAGARGLVSGLPRDLAMDVDIRAAASAVELAEEGAGQADGIAAVQARVEADPEDLEARYELGKALFAAGQTNAAVEALIEVVRRDRDWNDSAARKQLIKIFEALGSTHPQTVAARRKLSSILFS